MKNIGKRVLCLLFAAVMLLSLVAVPDWNAQATEEQTWVGHILFDYNYAHFVGGGNVTEISDADAHLGTAKIYTGVNLSAASIPLYRYEAKNPEFQYEYMKLGTVAREDLKVDQGYQTYSFETTIPAEGMLGAGNTVYFTHNWTIKNDQMAKDLYTLAGKTVTITMSMKITGALSSATVYVDRMQITDTCEDNLSADGSYCTSCGKSFEEPSAHLRFDYDYTYFVGGGNVTEISDADAHLGTAKIYTGVNLSAASIPLYRYEAKNPEFQYEYMKLGAVAREDLKVDQGYQTYSFETTIPAEGMLGAGNTVYFTDNWTIKNDQMAKDLYTLAGKTVTITMSMKITGALSSATVYVDRMQITDSCEDNLSEDGTQCTVCGKIFEQTSAHLRFDYDYTYFAGGGNVTEISDADAYQGTAKIYTGLNLDVPSIPLYRYEAKNPEFQYEYMKLGAVAREDLKVDQGYQIYSFETTIPAEGMKGNGNYVYFTDSCTIQNAQMAKDLYTLAGKTVTITMSMKITGALSSATVYVDRMQILDSCEDNLSEDGSYCTVCGKSMIDESLPEELQKLDAKHIKSYNSENFGLDGGGSIEADADSPVGKAWSGNKSVANGIKVYRYAAAGADFEHQYLELMNIPAGDIKMNDGYHFYKSAVKVPTDIVTPGTYVYVGDWFCQNRALCNDLVNYAGKTVDFYLSMKLTGTDAANAQIYIDQMFLADSCENNRVGDTCSVCGKDLSVGDPSAHDLFDYNFSFFTGDEVSDADANEGKAKRFEGLNLTAGAAVKIYRYDPTCSEFELQYLNLGALPAGNIQVDQGYQTYQFEVTLPAEGMTDKAPFVYFTDNWSVQNAQMAKDLYTLAGKHIGLVLSMKVEGDLTYATVYIDRARLVDLCTDYVSEDGTYCTKCGASLETIEPDEPEEPTVPEDVHFVYTADDFTLALSESNGDCVLEDSASEQGKAAVLSYETRAAVTGNNQGSLKDLLRTGSQKLKMYIYGGDPVQSRLVREFSIKELKANAAGGKYVEYTVRDIDLIPTNHNYYFYMFDSWGFKLNIPSSHQKAIHNQGYVDVTISMKITGDVSSTKNPPTYYIDKIEINAAESGKTLCRHAYNQWTIEQLTHSGTCSVCGEAKTEFHKWDEGVVTKELTEKEKGEKLYTCTICGGTKTEKFDNKLRFVFHADSFHLPSAPDYIAKDSKAPHGMAAVFSSTSRAAAGHDAKDLLRTGDQRLTIYSYGGDPKESRMIGELDVKNLQKNANGGKYVTYKFKGVNIFPDKGSYFLYMFDSWRFQIPLSQAQVNAMLGKKMDMFMTMRVVGNVESKVTYYIDEIILQETSSEGDHLIVYVPKRVVPKQFTSLPAEYMAADFRLPLAEFGSGDVVVDDSTSAYGKAVMLSYEARKKYDGEGNGMIREPGKLLRMYTDTAILVGEWTSAQLQENSNGGKYVVYEFKNLNLTGSKFMYMFDCWGFQIPMEKLTGALEGKNVDVKVSMKVTGDVTNREENTPCYFIDFISVTESAPIPEHEHVYENWITDILSHKGSCTVCGLRQEGFHIWDEGVVTKEVTDTEDGQTVYTCQICGMQDAKKIKRKAPAKVEEPVEEQTNYGVIIGCVAAGFVAIVIAVVVVLLLVKKSRKKS